MRKVRKGLVIAKPTAYSDTNYQPIDPGVPNHRIYVGHDTLQTMALMGRKSATIQYYPSTKEQIDFLSLADIGALVDAEVGETVYFHPNVTEPENLHEEHESYSVFKALPDALICVGTRMQAGWVLVEPHEDATVDSGFILSVEPIHKMLEGTVRHIRSRPDLSPGDHVYFQHDSNWEYEVEGVTYYAMKEDNIWMKKVIQFEEIRVCPYCNAPAEEKFIGDEGATFCTDGCGCLEGERVPTKYLCLNCDTICDEEKCDCQ